MVFCSKHTIHHSIEKWCRSIYLAKRDQRLHFGKILDTFGQGALVFRCQSRWVLRFWIGFSRILDPMEWSVLSRGHWVLFCVSLDQRMFQSWADLLRFEEHQILPEFDSHWFQCRCFWILGLIRFHLYKWASFDRLWNISVCRALEDSIPNAHLGSYHSSLRGQDMVAEIQKSL